MPVFTGAGRNVRRTSVPPCKPRPTQSIAAFKVRRGVPPKAKPPSDPAGPTLSRNNDINNLLIYVQRNVTATPQPCQSIIISDYFGISF
jgi:hypothetical protein